MIRVGGDEGGSNSPSSLFGADDVYNGGGDDPAVEERRETKKDTNDVIGIVLQNELDSNGDDDSVDEEVENMLRSRSVHRRSSPSSTNTTCKDRPTTMTFCSAHRLTAVSCNGLCPVN